MLKTIGIVLLVAVVGVLVIAAMRPAEFTVSRSTSIGAPAEVVYPLIADFRNWGEWSPFEKMDPAMKRTLSGAESGRGAVYAWEGNDQAGAGRMEIKDATPSNIQIQLDFTKPFPANDVVDFALTPSDGATTVTWTMRGRNGYLGKLINLFFSMDSMVGGQFDSGLAALKAAAEQRAKAAPPSSGAESSAPESSAPASSAPPTSAPAN